MKNLYTRILLSLVLSFSMIVFAAAQRTITGNVMDNESGEPLIGASVVEDAGNTGVLTEIDGSFALDVPDEATSITVSYTGFTAQTIDITGKNVINVSLSPGVLIDEVVVIGYGAVKKSDLTGSVSSVGEKDFNRGAIATPEQLLEGRAAGIQITSASGAPGAATAINIRGFSSLRGDNSPLIVIDGVQLDNRSPKPGGEISDIGASPGSNPFAFIDPNEIASIEVLKDASATAIYGSRGANGVIIITTKKGREGAASVDYSVQQGFSQIANKPDYLSAGEYRDALTAENLSTDNDFGADVDALDEILQTGYTNSHSLALSGGEDKFSYRVFGSLFDQKGIVQNSRLKKYIGGMKSSFKLFKDDRVTLDLALTASNLTQDDVPVSNNAGYEGSLIGAALQWNPTKALIKDDGSFDQDVVEQRNPLALNEYIKDQTNTTRFIGNIGATVKIIEGLSYKYVASFDQARAERRVGVDPNLNLVDVFGRGQAIVGNSALGSIQFLNTLNYQKDITDALSINAVAGYEHLKYTNRGTRIFATDLASNTGLDLTDILGSAANANQRVESFHDPDVNIRSIFGRLILNYGDKYLLTTTIRSDASSKFGQDNRTGYFPSFSLAWNIDKESFAPEFFDVLKLRAGWGRTGNQEFPAGAALEKYAFQNGGLSLRNNPNSKLTWESSDQINAGLDFAFNNYRVSGSIDYFNKKTQDQILFVVDAQPVPSVEGRTYKNVDGVIKNSGIELALNYSLIEKANLRWNAGLNYTFLTNTVEDFVAAINTGAINGQGLTGAFAQRIENGQSLYGYYLPVFVGLNEEGLSEYEDPVNGGTTIIATVNSVKQFVGDPLPDHLLGLSTSVEYGDFDVQLNMNGAFGHQIYNNTSNAVFVKGNLANGRNILADQVGNGESPNNSYPASTRYLENGSYFRLSNLTVGYTFRELPGILKNAKLTLTGQNLYTFTGYSGFDPVVNVDKAIDGIPSFGIDYTAYPTSRTFLVGLSVKL